MPDISIIVPIYHGRNYISSLLQMAEDNYSRLNGEASVEMIFVNDSPEETICIERKLPFPVRVVDNKKNQGIHQSRVNGLACAEGSFVTFWDQDDTWRPDFLHSQYKHIGNADVIIGDAVYGNGVRLFKDEAVIPHLLDPVWYIQNLIEIISPGQTLIRRGSIPSSWIRFIMKTNYCDDAYLWVLMKDQHKTFAINRDCLYTHTETGNNTSLDRNRNIAALQELYDIVCSNHLISGANMAGFKDCIEKRIINNREYIEVENVLSDAAYLTSALKDYEKISIYGYGVNGMKAVKAIHGLGKHISHIYDRDAVSGEYRIERLGDRQDDSDLVIVTVLNDRKKIISWVKRHTSGRVIGILELIGDSYELKNAGAERCSSDVGMDA